MDLRKTLFVLPNAITLAAVFCGFNAIRIVANAQGPEATDDFYRAALLLIFSMFFDLMDGRVARLTKTQSAFGLQMDSLADIVSFGVAPALLVYQWVLFRLELFGLLASFLFIACAAIRLARFNVLSASDDGAPTVPGKYILGLPSPPASGVLISLVVANHAMDGALGDPRYTISILVMTVVMGLLMVSNVRFRSFKDLRLNTGTILLILFIIVSSAFVWREPSICAALAAHLLRIDWRGRNGTRVLGQVAARQQDGRSNRSVMPLLLAHTRALGLVTCLFLFAACDDNEPAPPETPEQALAQAKTKSFPPPRFALTKDTPNVLFTWVDKDGAFQISESGDEIPAERRQLVRVVVEGQSPGGAEYVYVADLSTWDRGENVPVRALSRLEWELQGKDQREKKVAALRPPPEPDAPSPTDLGVDAIIYGADWCKPCHMAEAYLKKKGVKVIKKDIEEDPSAAKEMRAKLKKAGMHGASIPVLDVGGTILRGFSERAIDAALKR